jgi:Ca2+:H+ antiporter
VQRVNEVEPQDASGERKVDLDKRAIMIRSIVLVALILPIVVLAHDLAILIDLGIDYAGAPVAVGGLLIAIIVFTPESITAVKAALANEMQRAINLCLGAFVSTVGLTVPAVLTIALVTGKTVILGLNGLDTVLLVLTIALSTLTFLGLRTSPVQGMIHLTLFAIYAVLLFVP